MPIFNMLDFSNSSDSNSVNYWFEVFKILLSSWQLVFIIVIFLFKKQLIELLDAVINKINLIVSFKYKDIEATMSETIENNTPEQSQLETNEDEENEIPASMRFINAWIKFEANIRQKYASNYCKSGSVMKILRPLVNEVITKDEYMVLIRINDYRNLLLHENYTDLPKKENYRFIEFLEAITLKLDKAYSENNRGENSAN